MIAQRLAGGEAQKRVCESQPTRKTAKNNIRLPIKRGFNTFNTYLFDFVAVKHPHLISWFHITS